MSSARLFLAWLIFLVCAVAFAQTDVERANREAQRLLLEEQQRLSREREILEQRSRTEGADLQPNEVSSAPASGCFTIREVQVDGAGRLNEAELRELTAAGIGDCISLAQINAVMQAITNHYLVRGFTTTRVYLPEQDLSSGTLKLLVLEGLIEGFRLDGEGVHLGTAFPGLIGELFNLRDIEQGLDQINRLRSNAATMDIEPGTVAGASRVVVRNAPRKRWSVNAAADNTGSASTGRNLVSVALSLDNPLGINDFLNLSTRINSDADQQTKLSRSLSVLYSIPYGYWTFSFTASEFDYASLVQGAVTTFRTSGKSTNQGLRIDRVLFRDRDSKVSVFSNLAVKSSRNLLNDTLLESSSRRLATLDLGVSGSTSTGGAMLSGDLAWVRGLDAFGALRDTPGQDSAAPKAQFSKIVANASLSGSSSVAGQSVTLSSSLSAQRARHALYGTEQFLIGGPFSVRGFRRYSISGDSGIWLRNEAGMPISVGQTQLRPFVGWDIGRIRADAGGPGGTLAGVTLGVSVNHGSFNAQISLSRPTVLPERLGTSDRYLHLRASKDF